MKYRHFLIIGISLLISINIYGQDEIDFSFLNITKYNGNNSKPIKYTIDRSIIDSINKSMSPEDGQKIELFTIKDILKTNDQGELSFFTVANFINPDTIIINGYYRQIPGVGFTIRIVNDSSRIFFFYSLLSSDKDARVFKLNKEDKKYKISLLIPTISSKLKLTKAPEFKVGEIIEGYLELETQDYYYRPPANKSAQINDVKKRITLRGYFRTEYLSKR